MLAIWCIGSPEFERNDKVVSLVYHLPEIEPGTKGVIVLPHVGNLYAVQLPNGELHRWFAEFELEPIEPNNSLLCPGSFAKIIYTEGHPSYITQGMIVKIVKVICQTPFYDLILDNGAYHRWIAEFEIVPLTIVS